MEAVDGDGREIRVLVVEDDDSIRLFLSEFLTENGVCVHTVSDGVQGMEVLKAIPVHLVVTDQRMPRMSGLELIRWSKTHFPKIPAVLMTGQVDAELIAVAQACGAMRVFVKPFPVEDLLSLVWQVCDPGQFPEFSVENAVSRE